MKKTRRFVALLLAAVLALALFTACGAAQPTIGEQYEKWFVEQLNSKLPEGKTVKKVDVKHSEMMAALAKIDKDGKFTAGDGWDEGAQGIGDWYWLILSDSQAWAFSADKTIDAVPLTPENMTKYGPVFLTKKEYLKWIREYDIATRVIDGKTYVAVYVHLEKWY